MIERYLKHRKWTNELKKYLKLPEINKCLIDVFLKMDLTKIYILTDIKNHISYRLLRENLGNSKGIAVVYEKDSDEFRWNQMDGNSLVIADEHHKMQAFQTGTSFLSLFDLYNLLVNRQYYVTEIPRILNSIENGYRSIGIVGNSVYSSRIFSYLQKNANVKVVKIEEEYFSKATNNRAYYYSGVDEIDIIVASDFRVNAQVIDKEENPIPAFFLINLTSLGNSFIGDLTYDIERKIVPYLVQQGVAVVWCQAPNSSIVTSKVQRKIKRDSTIRSVCPKIYSGIRKHELQKEKLGFMYGLGKETRIDCSKGYRECFGNMEHLNYDNGFRRTIGNDSESKKSLWVFGPCLVDPNSRVDDTRTVTSVLKEKIGRGYNVHNRGGSFGGMGLLIRNTRFKKGDIVVIFSSRKDKNNLATCNFDLTESYAKINSLEKHINDNLLHCDSSVIRQIAEDIFTTLKTENLLCYEDHGEDNIPICLGSIKRRVPSINMLEEGGFKQYLLSLQKNKENSDAKKTGAIVMNCNPFTLGHRYLIETAALQVDKLYVFVVEEDKSFFPFKDRYELVKKGTQDLSNVDVIPSGNYIISSQTLAGYFEKDSIGHIYLDATTDLELFAQIADVLNITVRFAGEEPIDAFTRQYNENMRATLESYGIKFVEIKRKEESGQPISASRVRNLLKQKDFEAISEIVPVSTYEYLKERAYLQREKKEIYEI